MKRTALVIMSLMALLFLQACGTTSGFAVATKANTKRADDYQVNLLSQATNHLNLVNSCYLSAAGYAQVIGSPGTLHKVGEPGSSVGCTVMATAFGTQDALLQAFAPFIAKELMARVPAAPEEIVENLITKGFEFSLVKYGIDAVRGVVDSGQLANAQIASQGIEAASKPAQVIDKPFIVQVPTGSAPLAVQP